MAAQVKPTWCAPSLPVVDAPLRGRASERSPELLQRIVDQFEVETTERYRRRDVTGDGKSESFCNIFVSDVTRALSCEIPKQLANAMTDWLDNFGRQYGWFRVDRDLAWYLSKTGVPIVAGWKNPAGGHGHVALLVPPPDGALWCAQAGSKNFSRGRLVDGFGSAPARFWAHA